MEFSALEIARFLEGDIDGNAETRVSRVSKIEDGRPGALAFLSNMKYEHHLYTSEASVVLVNRDFVPKEPVKATLIRVNDAYQAFASLLEMYVAARERLKTGIEQPSFVHESASLGKDCWVGAFAYIGRNVTIGRGVKIYPHTFIGDNVTVGEDTILYSGVKIYPDSILGSGCILHSGAVIGSDGFGFAPLEDGSYKKIPQIGNVILEDFVEIGANTTIDCGTMGSTIIRTGVKLDNQIQIAHNCEVGAHTVMAAQTGLAGTTKIGQFCKFAGQVGFAGHLTIGDNVQIGAQSGVTKNLKGDQIVMGSPVMEIKHAVKTYSVFRNLPQLRQEIIDLQQEVKTLRSDINQLLQ